MEVSGQLTLRPLYPRGNSCNSTWYPLIRTLGGPRVSLGVFEKRRSVVCAGNLTTIYCFFSLWPIYTLDTGLKR